MFMVFAVFLVTTIIALYIYQIIQMIKLAPSRGPFVLPLFGNVLQIYLLHVIKRYEIFELMLDVFEKYGPTVQFHFGPFKRIVVTSDPQLVQKVIMSFKTVNKNSVYDFLIPFMGSDGVLTGNGSAKWHKRKKIATIAFNMPSYLEDYVSGFNCVAQTLLNELQNFEDGEPFNAYKILTAHVLDSIHKANFGREASEEIKINKEYLRSMYGCSFVTMRRIFSVFRQLDFVFNRTEDGQLFKKHVETIQRITLDLVEKRKKLLLDQFDQNLNVHNESRTYLNKLLTEQQRDSSAITRDNAIFEDLSSLIFAGHDTISYTLSFAFYLLAHHPEIQEKILEEINEILGNDTNTTTLTVSQLNEMKYLELVLKESLRLYPPVPFLGRRLQEQLELGNLKLPINTECMVFINLLHRDETFFPNAEQFIPERFLDPEIERMAYIPFSGGIRKCSGVKYAMLEMKVLTVNIIKRYKILPVSNYKPTIVLGIASKPRGGLKLRTQLRH